MWHTTVKLVKISYVMASFLIPPEYFPRFLFISNLNFFLQSYWVLLSVYTNWLRYWKLWVSLMSQIKTITSCLKVLIYIITSITLSPMWPPFLLGLFSLLLYIPDFILKLYISIRSCHPYDGQNGAHSNKNKGNDNYCSIILL